MSTRSLFTVLVFVFLVPVANAGPGGFGHHRGPLDPFELLDANGDGSISTAEFEVAQTERFNAFDADKSGAISATEFATGHERFIELLKSKRFAKLDTNNDGQLSPQEFAVGGDKLFNLVDSNDDGSVSKPEARFRREMNGRR